MRDCDRRPAWIASVSLLLLGSVHPAGAQVLRSPAAHSSMNAYLPELQRLQQKGDFPGMERAARQALAELQSALGPNSAEVANALRWLSLALHAEGRSADAEAQVRHALAIDEAALGASAVTAMDLNGVANLLWEQKRFADAEPFARRALQIRDQVLGPEHLETGASANNLAELLQAQGRYHDAEPLYRRSLAIREKGLPAEHPGISAALARLAVNLEAQGRYAEAEPLFRRELASQEKLLGSEHAQVAVSLEQLAGAVAVEGRHAEAETLYRRALAIREKTLGSDHPNTAETLSNLARMLEAQGRVSEAEPLMRRALAIYETKLGPESGNVATLLNNLAGLCESQGRYAEAEPLHRRALAIAEKVKGPEHPDTATNLNNLALLLTHLERYSEAEPLYRRALAINEKTRGPDHQLTAGSLNNLAQLLSQEGRPAEAEPLMRRALAIDEKIYGAEGAGVITDINNLAGDLGAQGRYADADPLFRRARTIAEKALGPEHHLTAGARVNLAQNDEHLGKLADAVDNYRGGCATDSALARVRGQSADAARKSQGKATRCWTFLSLSLWNWAEQGGGTAAADKPEALKREAFAASQRAVQSAAGDAMARSAALTAATSAAVGPQAQAYEAALLKRDDLNQQFALAAARTGTEGTVQRAALGTARDQAIADISRLESELKAKAPLYWDYRAPEPIVVADLQVKSGANAGLLQDEEALIVFLVAGGKDKGLVFALNKERAAWARLGLSGDDIKARVTKLRGQIDPEGYGLSGTPEAGGAFDRQASYELYQALLGDAAIQSVMQNKPALLFVPSGALTSLPPGLLVTSPPPGGKKGDTDPAALRATAWLLRSKAVALLPAVSSLRTLRQMLSRERGAAADPLLAFADPDFERPARAPPKKRSASAAARGFSGYYRDGVPLAEALDYLPRLPGTRIEGEALQSALHAGPGSLLTGRDASKAQLMARNQDGRLRRVRVLEFATHGLVAGDASDLAEPALALAAGATPADELLLASEASTLKLNADWVLLSACNTASPDAPEAQGLSGLSRAFFFAGGRSLLVSHWRVRDDVAPKLIPAMLLAERDDAALSHAQALRQASLAILDDTTINAADPAAWAAFTLIGEAAR